MMKTSHDQFASLRAKYGEIVRYLVIGGLTTGLNMLVFFGLLAVNVSWFWANLAGWVVSVTFAFITNKLFVFGSKSLAGRVLMREAIAFYALRLFSLLADNAILFVGLTLLNGSPLLVKLIDQVVVIGLNYIFSKRIFH